MKQTTKRLLLTTISVVLVLSIVGAVGGISIGEETPSIEPPVFERTAPLPGEMTPEEFHKKYKIPEEAPYVVEQEKIRRREEAERVSKRIVEANLDVMRYLPKIAILELHHIIPRWAQGTSDLTELKMNLL